MKRTAAPLTLILVLLAASFLITNRPVSAVEAAENTWTTKAPMHEARGSLGVAVVNGKIYAIGGQSGTALFYYVWGEPIGFTYNGTNEEYDPKTDAWTFKSPMPTPRANFGITVYQNKIYCIGGTAAGGASAVNEVYDPTTDRWTPRSAIPATASYLTANVVNHKIYLISVRTNNSLNKVYDPSTDSWSTRTPPPLRITSRASAVFDDKIYFLVDDNDSASQCLLAYNAANDSWSSGVPLPSYVGISAIAGVTAGLMAPKGLYFFDENVTLLYDPVNYNWTMGATAKTSRGYFSIANVDDIFYAIGGAFFPSEYSVAPIDISTSAVNDQYTPFGYGTISHESEAGSFPILPVATVSIIAVTAAGLLLYNRKRRKEAQQK